MLKRRKPRHGDGGSGSVSWLPGTIREISPNSAPLNTQVEIIQTRSPSDRLWRRVAEPANARGICYPEAATFSAPNAIERVREQFHRGQRTHRQFQDSRAAEGASRGAVVQMKAPLSARALVRRVASAAAAQAIEVELASHERRIPHDPLASLFPLLDGDEFDALVADIRAYGLRQRIVLLEGVILDGRNRYAACLEAGIEPRFEVFNGARPARLCDFAEPATAAFERIATGDCGREDRNAERRPAIRPRSRSANWQSCRNAKRRRAFRRAR